MVAPAHANKHWYTAREFDGYFRGVVYHYDSTGNREILDYKSQAFNDQGEAEEAAITWADEHNIDVELE